MINTPVGTGARDRRLGDPRGGDRPRDPVHHHDDRRRWRPPARSRPRAAASPRCVSLQEIHADAGRARSREPRSAPFGRRAAIVTAREEHGAYVVLACRDGDGPRPDAGQFYMLERGRALGRGERRAAVPPAGVQRPARVERAAGVELQFLIEDVGPGTSRLAELGAGERLTLVGPLGNGVRAAARGPSGRCSSAAASGSRRSRSGRTSWAPGRPAHCSDSETPPHAARRRAPDRPARSPPTTGRVGHHGLVTELLERRARRPRRRARGLRVRAARDARGGQGDLRRAASVPAQLALESGMACGFGACFGCVVPTETAT